MRLILVLLGLVTAAGVAHSHDAVELPELPVPEIEQLFPVDDMEAAFRWADRSPLDQLGNKLFYWPVTGPNPNSERRSISPNRWHVVALSEGQFGRVASLLAGIQEDLIPGEGCGISGLDGRFGVSLLGWSQGGVDYEFLWTLARGHTSRQFSDVKSETHHLLKNRFSVVGGAWAADTELRDTGFSMRFRFILVDYVGCAGWHTSHSNGSARHNGQSHQGVGLANPKTDWIPIADLLDGNIAVTAPAEPDPAEPADPVVEVGADDSAELAQLRATVSALRDSLSAAGVGAAALRGALLALQAQIDALQVADGATTITLIDTVEVARVDTLHYCPPTDEDRQDLFDAFTGLQDSTAAAPKAAAVQVESWGAIKALVREE